MKRIVTLLLAAGLVLGAAGAGNAADVKVKGSYDFAFGWANSFKKDAAADKFKAELMLGGGSGTRTFGHAAASGHFSLADKEIIMNAHCSVMVVRVPKIEQLFRIS